MAEPVMRSEREVQRAHDVLGIAASYRLLGTVEHNRACEYGEALCWVLGHDHGAPSDFEKFFHDLEQVLDGLGLSQLAEVSDGDVP